MYEGRTVFPRLTDHLPWQTFHQLLQHDHVDSRVKAFTSSDQILCIAFARFAYLDSLRNIEYVSAQYPRSLPTWVPDLLRRPEHARRRHTKRLAPLQRPDAVAWTVTYEC